MKRFFIGFALVAFAATACAKDWSTIRFGVDASYPPFESKDASGKVVGFDVDLGNQICARLKAKCVWIENDFDGMIPALKARKFDGILSSMAATPKRAEQIAFSDRIWYSPKRLIAKKGANILPTPESLAGKSVGVEQGSTEEAYARTYWAPKDVKVMAYQNQDQVYTDLISGRLDAALQSGAQADFGFLRTARGAGFEFAGGDIVDPATSKGVSIGLRKDDTDLKAKINQAIADMLKDGTYKEIAQKYFAFNIYGH